MNWLIFTAASLATFRVTRLITDDKIMDWFRRDVGKAGKKAREGVRCPYCVSFWVGCLVVAGLWYLGYVKPQEAILWHWAIWGASVLWNQVFVKLSK